LQKESDEMREKLRKKTFEWEQIKKTCEEKTKELEKMISRNRENEKFIAESIKADEPGGLLSSNSVESKKVSLTATPLTKPLGYQQRSI
jgi:hypothetical protein